MAILEMKPNTKKIIVNTKQGKIKYARNHHSNVSPYFAIKDVSDAVQIVKDVYSVTINFMKNTVMDPLKQNCMYIRCAGWILYSFVSLQPFSKVNEKMCRLLASYCLYLVLLFPCLIFNIYTSTKRDDYVGAITKTHCLKGENLDLVAILMANFVKCFKTGAKFL